MRFEYDEKLGITFRDIMRDAIECDSRIPKSLLDFREYVVWKILEQWKAQESVRKNYFDVRDSKGGDIYITRHTFTKVVGIVPKNYRRKGIVVTLPLLRRELEAFEPTRELLELDKELHHG